MRTARATGFTIIELMIVIVIVGVMVSLAAPSMRDLIVRTRLKTAASDLHQSLMQARSEAIMRNAVVQVVPNSATNWALGWSVKEQAGGTVLGPPMDVGPHGRMAIALDPQGNPFGIWQAGATTGVEVYNEPGGLVWNEAAVDDPAAAREFYGRVFGFSWQEVPGAGGYTTFATGDRPLGGLSGIAPGLPAGWATCFSVASTDEAVRAAEAGGGKVLMAAQDTEFGRFAVVADPWGASFSVMAEPAG